MKLIERWRKRIIRPEDIDETLTSLHYLAELADPDHARRIESQHLALVETSGEIPRPPAQNG